MDRRPSYLAVGILPADAFIGCDKLRACLVLSAWSCVNESPLGRNRALMFLEYSAAASRCQERMKYWMKVNPCSSHRLQESQHRGLRTLDHHGDLRAVVRWRINFESSRCLR